MITVFIFLSQDILLVLFIKRDFDLFLCKELRLMKLTVKWCAGSVVRQSGRRWQEEFFLFLSTPPLPPCFLFPSISLFVLKSQWSFLFASDLNSWERAALGTQCGNSITAQALRLCLCGSSYSSVSRFQHGRSGVLWSLQLCCYEVLGDSSGTAQAADRTHRKALCAALPCRPRQCLWRRCDMWGTQNRHEKPDRHNASCTWSGCAFFPQPQGSCRAL